MPLRGFLHDKYHHDLLITSDSQLVSVLIAVFDVAGHNIVMKKLEYTISIKGNTLYWFELYLWDTSWYYACKFCWRFPQSPKGLC